MIEPLSPNPVFAPIAVTVHPHATVDPWLWRQVEVAIGTGDLDSVITSLLSAIDYKGL